MNNHSITTIERFITSNISSGSPGCVAGVLQHGETVYAKGFGRANLEYPSPISAETVFDIGSMAKQFVGMAVALLEEEGRIDTTAGIRDYLPDLPDYTHRIKVANLLHHTSGIRNYTVLAYYMIGYHESDAISPEEVYDLLKSVQTGSFAPGERYEYSDSNYFLLGKIVEQVSGKTLGEFAAENIFQPLGMENTLFRECHSRVIPNRAISYVQHPVR
ncbi:MAG: serine hydrolase domain-containing protein, partial [Anaerolineales bacterium]